MKVVDFFAGLRGWSDQFKERGHEVWTVDNDKRFDVDCYKDILDITEKDFPFRPDVFLASPPCTGFSMMSCRNYWHKTIDGVFLPRNRKAVIFKGLLERTLYFVEIFAPPIWIIENPRGVMRKLPIMRGIPRTTVTYCQYHSDDEGPKRMKPTDLFGNMPRNLSFAPMCKNGDPCHVAAPRGSFTGTQGMDPALSAKIPKKLALEVCKACEEEFAGRQLDGK